MGADVGLFLRQNKTFIIVHFLVIPILAVLTFFSILPPQWMALCVVCLEILYNLEPIKNRWRSSQHHAEVKSRTKSFNSELRSFENRFQGEFLELQQTGNENLIEYVQEVVPNGDSVRLGLLYLYLNDISDYELENHEITLLTDGLSQILREFSLTEPSKDDLRFAWGVYQLLCEDKSNINLSPPNEEFFSDDCFQKEFVHRYVHKEKIISKLTTEQTQLAEYRDILATLFEDGKLDRYGIQQTLMDYESDGELSLVLTNKNHFFIMMNELQRTSSIKADISTAVQNDGHSIHSGSMQISGGMYSVLLAICDSETSTQEFYERYVEEPFEETDENGWLSIHRAKFEGEPVLKKRYRSKDPSENALEGMAKQNLFTTGQEVKTVIHNEKLIESYLSTDELLSVLPLNIFLPDVSSTKKNVIMENNEVIKKEFGIQKLTDWANTNHTKEEIGKYLYHNFFPEDSEEYWIEKASEIIEKSEEINDALNKSAASDSGEVGLVPWEDKHLVSGN